MADITNLNSARIKGIDYLLEDAEARENISNLSNTLDTLRNNVTDALVYKDSLSFANLPDTSTVGWMYEITNDFITNTNFTEANKDWPAGTFVFYTKVSDDVYKWKVLTASGGVAVINITQAEYDALSTAAKNKEVFYNITDSYMEDTTVGLSVVDGKLCVTYKK